MTKKKNTIMAIMLAVVAVMSIAYAYFATNLNITSTGSISSSWDVKFIGITNDTPVGSATNVTTPSYTATTATMSADLKLPGDSITYRITLKNNGDIGAIIEDINASATGSGAIIFSMSGLNIGEKLAGGAEKEIVVKIEYDPLTTSQPTETTKTLTISIKAVQDTGQSIDEETPDINQPIDIVPLSTAILKNNDAQSDENIDLSKDWQGYIVDETTNWMPTPTVTNGNGFFYTNDNTENGQTTYYFRGQPTTNYVQFGSYKAGTIVNGTTYSEDTPIYWRIIRINEDGSVRLIYNGTSVNNDVIIGNTTFNSTGRDNAYVGYMYGTPGSDNYKDTHTNTNDSTIKEMIDNWYVQHLKDNYSSYLTDTGFCNDRRIAPIAGTWTDEDTALGYGTNLTVYSASNRLFSDNSIQPQFACSQENDLFTTKTSNKGNQALEYPIGLITADELWYSGAGMIAGSNFLTSGGPSFWTMTPGSAADATIFKIWDLGGQYGHTIGEDGVSASSSGVRPVINVRGNVGFALEGTGDPGTSTNPYVIKTN